MKLIINEQEIKTAIIEWIKSNHGIAVNWTSIELQSEEGFNVYKLIAIVEEIDNAVYR